MYLAPRAIPRLYAQELMQKISSVTSGSFTTVSVCVCVCVRVCVRACVRVCGRAGGRACT